MALSIEQQLQCFGYFGFGSGYALAKWGVADDTRELYCGRCSQSKECWKRHRVRVHTISPDLAALCEKIGKENPQSKDFIRAWLKATDQSPKHFVEPFSSVMQGNTEDGARIALGDAPKDRGPQTLTWPLEQLTPVP